MKTLQEQRTESVLKMQERITELEKENVKAKEIIKKLYSHVFQGMGFTELNDFNVLKAEAEQFLNEVEK